MNTAIQSEGKAGRGESMVLNLICVLVALVFVALAVLNYFSEGSFLSTDSLFITLVWAMLVLLFLSVPALDMMSRGVLRLPFSGRKNKATPAAGGGDAPVTDSRGRSMPPDVRGMMSAMKRRKP